MRETFSSVNENESFFFFCPDQSKKSSVNGFHLPLSAGRNLDPGPSLSLSLTAHTYPHAERNRYFLRNLLSLGLCPSVETPREIFNFKATEKLFVKKKKTRKLRETLFRLKNLQGKNETNSNTN